MPNLTKMNGFYRNITPAKARVKSRMRGFLSSADHQTTGACRRTMFRKCRKVCCGICAEMWSRLQTEKYKHLTTTLATTKQQLQVSAAAGKLLQHTASCPTCCPDMWTINMIN